jgi:phosphate transport system substrate-binding protein
MNVRNMPFAAGFSVVVLSIVLSTVLAACGSPDGGDADQLRGTILIDGSSTVFPITEAVAEEFMSEQPRVRVSVGVSGTGGGFAKFGRNETDLSNASRPISRSEVELAAGNGVEFIELPVAYDGLAVIVHRNNDWAECLTLDELRRIWESGSSVSRWSQVRDGFPDRPITLYGPGTDSGTYDYFTKAVTGHEGNSRPDFTASEDDNVLVQGIAGDQGSLGFFGLAYYENNRDRLRLVAIDDGDQYNGEGCVQPSAQTVREGTYQPLSRPEFIYVKRSSAERPEVQAFVDFYLRNARRLAEEVGYIGMDDEVYELGRQRFERQITGSMFDGGSQLALSMNELLRQGQDAAQPGDAPARESSPDPDAGRSPVDVQ